MTRKKNIDLDTGEVIKQPRHDERGREIPDPTPIAMPAGLRKPESVEDMIRRFVRVEASRIAAAQDMETFEEADDFELEDDDDPDMVTLYSLPEIDMTPETGPEGPESLDGGSGTPLPEAGTKRPMAPPDKSGGHNPPLDTRGGVGAGGEAPSPG